MAKLTQNNFVSPGDVAAVAVEGLEVSASLAKYVLTDVNRDAYNIGDFVNFYVPSLLEADERDVRSHNEINVSDYIDNDKRAVKLSKNIYKAIGVTDAEMTLDISDFSRQIVKPIVDGVSRKIEKNIATTISSASHKVEISGTKAPHEVFAVASAKLTEFLVPQSDRVIVVGTGVQALLTSGPNAAYNYAGDSDAYRRGEIGMIQGAPVAVSPYIPSNQAFMFHRSAFPVVIRSPRVTEATATDWAYGTGATAVSDNFAITCLRDRDARRMQDIFIGSVYAGFGTVTDKGKVTNTGGSAKFTPWTTSADPSSAADDCLIRSIKMVFTQAQ